MNAKKPTCITLSPETVRELGLLKIKLGENASEVIARAITLLYSQRIKAKSN